MKNFPLVQWKVLLHANVTIIFSPAHPWVQITQAWFCASQQEGSGKENQSRYVQREEWHYCVWLVAECRILLTFGIWHSIRLAGTQGLAPAFDMPGQGGTWTTLCLMHLSTNTHTQIWKLEFIISEQCRNIFVPYRLTKMFVKCVIASFLSFPRSLTNVTSEFIKYHKYLINNSDLLCQWWR